MLGAELAAYLAVQGYGTVNTDLFYNFMPPDPDVAMSIISYGGEADEPDLGIDGRNTRLEFIRFQLLTRGIRDDSDGPELRCSQARLSLVAVINQPLSGVRYVGIDALSPPAPLMHDDNFRHYWASNLRAIKSPSTAIIVTPGGGSIYENRLPIRIPYQLGGSDTISDLSATPTWIDVPGVALDVNLDGIVLAGVKVTAIVELKAFKAGIGVTARVRDITNSVTVGTSTKVISTTWVQVTFPLTLSFGLAYYRLQLLPDTVNADVFGKGYIEVG